MKNMKRWIFLMFVFLAPVLFNQAHAQTGAAIEVPNLATFRANSYGGVVHLQGTLIPGDTGGAFYYRNFLTGCTDNGTTIILDSAAHCYFMGKSPITETRGTKLRRLAAVAQANAAIRNPTSPACAGNVPTKRPAVWPALTALQTGEVYSNNGKWWAVFIGGTTSAASPPTAGPTNTLFVDGTVTWSYLCEAPTLLDDPTAPVITKQQAATPTGLANLYNPWTNQTFYSLYGAYATDYVSAHIAIAPLTFNSKAATPENNSSRIVFYTDAPKFGIAGVNGGAPIRILVNDQYITPGGQTTNAGGSPTWVIYDYSTATVPTGKITRKVTIELPATGVWAGVAMDANSHAWAPQGGDNVRAWLVSDSIVSGGVYGPALGGGSVDNYIGKALGWTDIWDANKPGTGYVNTGGGFFTYGQRIPEGLTRNPDVWILFGSTNDLGQSGRVPAMLAALQSIRNGGSTAPIIVIGCWPISNSGTGVGAVDTDLQTAITQFADPLGLTFYISENAATPDPYVTGTWNNAGNTNSTSANIMMGVDTVHPAGEFVYPYLGDRIARDIQRLVLPFIP